MKKVQSRLAVTIRKHREQQKLLLRQLASILNMDTAQLSKIENGLRPFKKEQLPTLAKALNTDQNELLTLWYTDRITDIIQDEPAAYQALKNVLNDIKKTKTNK